MFLCRCRGTKHTSDDKKNHFLVRGFHMNGHAYISVHAYAPDDSVCFDNGGKFKEGGCKMDLELECRPLVRAL